MKDAIQKRIDKAIEDQDSLTHIKLRKLPEHLRVLRDEFADYHAIEPNMIASFRGSYKAGFDAGALAVLEEAEKLVEALELYKGIPLHSLTGSNMPPSNVALQAYREKFGGGV